MDARPTPDPLQIIVHRDNKAATGGRSPDARTDSANETGFALPQPFTERSGNGQYKHEAQASGLTSSPGRNTHSLALRACIRPRLVSGYALPEPRPTVAALGLIAIILLQAVCLAAGELDRPIRGARDLLKTCGIDENQFARLNDRSPWEESDNELFQRILFRLRDTFRPQDIESWARPLPEWSKLAESPQAYQGELFRLTGRATRVDAIRPAPEFAEQFELPRYYRCELAISDQDRPAVVFAAAVPQAWPEKAPLNERVAVFGVFLKNTGPDARQRGPVFAALRVAWYPATPLGDLGMDVGLFDQLRTVEPPADGKKKPPVQKLDPQAMRLGPASRECFYQLLSAAGRATPAELVKTARESLKRQGRDRSSVVPLFNDAVHQQGNLVHLHGTARQVIPIAVSDEDVVARFGITRYYQVIFFTDDSQRNPLVFCCREIPSEMPQGQTSNYRESITATGFFFNTWAYHSRQSEEGPESGQRWQLAPLVIGHSLVWHPRRTSDGKGEIGTFYGTVLLVVVPLGVVLFWVVVWRTGRGGQTAGQRGVSAWQSQSQSLDSLGSAVEDGSELHASHASPPAPGGTTPAE
jgi:hypothetical protein